MEVTKAVEMVVDRALRDATDVNVVLGPVCWLPGKDGSGARRWYFTIATSGPEGFRHDSIESDSEDTCDQLRRAVWMALVQRKPRVIHDCDDELYSVRLCETLWPGPRITALRKKVEDEHRALQ